MSFCSRSCKAIQTYSTRVLSYLLFPGIMIILSHLSLCYFLTFSSRIVVPVELLWGTLCFNGMRTS